MFSAQDSGGSPCPSSCPDLNKSQTLSSLSESGAVLVEVCCLLVLAVDNKVPSCNMTFTADGFSCNLYIKKAHRARCVACVFPKSYRHLPSCSDLLVSFRQPRRSCASCSARCSRLSTRSPPSTFWTGPFSTEPPHQPDTSLCTAVRKITLEQRV